MSPGSSFSTVQVSICTICVLGLRVSRDLTEAVVCKSGKIDTGEAQDLAKKHPQIWHSQV